MHQLISWCSMGGYAAYIWPAYGLVFSVLILHLLGIKWQTKRARKSLQRWFKRQ